MKLDSKMMINFLFLLVSLHECVATVHFSRRLVGYTFLNQTGVSLVRCRRECSSRAVCRSINYRRIAHTCELNQGRSGTNVTLATSTGYIYEDISPACKCGVTERCYPDGTCVPDRCTPLEAPASSIISGKMNSIGAKTQLSWPANTPQFRYISTPVKLVCTPKGQWVQETLPAYKIKGTCTRMFRADSESGGDLYATWTTGVQSSDQLRCFDHGACPGVHYRHGDIDEWQNLKITSLRFSVYKQGSEIQYVVFNGTSSSSIDWFSHSRVLESSWTNLLSYRPLYFSMNGMVMNGIKRRFYMANQHSNCPDDYIWFTASTRTLPIRGCWWDGDIQPDPASVVTLRFSSTTDPENFVEPIHIDTADFLAVAACFDE